MKCNIESRNQPKRDLASKTIVEYDHSRLMKKVRNEQLKYLKAFLAKTGLEPDECEMVMTRPSANQVVISYRKINKRGDV